MSAALHLASAADLERLEPLVAAFHESEQIVSDPGSRREALMPILEGSPYGAAYLIGPARAPIGYIIITFGWSVEFGGLDGFVDELYLRKTVRGRGIASEVLMALPRTLAAAGLRALHLEVDRENASARKLYARCGFKLRERYALMTRMM